MFTAGDLSKLDWSALKHLPVSGEFWEFFDIAPYDGPCCNLACLVDYAIPWLYAWEDYVVFACSGRCVAEYVRILRSRFESKEIALNAAYGLVPVGEFGSFKVEKPPTLKIF